MSARKNTSCIKVNFFRYMKENKNKKSLNTFYINFLTYRNDGWILSKKKKKKRLDFEDMKIFLKKKKSGIMVVNDIKISPKLKNIG